MKLNQTKQCATCPWKKSTTVAEIPNYTRDRHEKLANTIADETGNLSKIGCPIKMMACHHSSDGHEYECIGWLYNQLGSGNHIPLRMIYCFNVKEIEVDDEQVASFDETFK
ncbi:MAG: hypothetical protein AV945_gp05 [Phormidium phage MIS-PhV1B]|uniref:hypothetical protein n=1 Tax=Phormidium phage MIS-PhV1B TaxID=1391456 RepID=UPI0003C9303E|nr:MAG: hypothetical protein AV945_gp05 [Phormidium phage MIS-PhV1B]AGZ61812.1 MAG: hypothetical protein [Phormidium phage MIS-PhV1B]